VSLKSKTYFLVFILVFLLLSYSSLLTVYAIVLAFLIVSLLVNKYLLFIYAFICSWPNCSKQEPEQQPEELPTEQTYSSSPTYYNIDDPKPAVVYANVAHSQKPASEKHHIYANVPSNTDHETNEDVLYVDLQKKDNDGHIMVPSDDFYADVQKH